MWGRLYLRRHADIVCTGFFVQSSWEVLTMQNSLKEQIQRALELGVGGHSFMMVRNGEVLRFGTQYESAADFLSTAYGRMISPGRKSMFRELLGELFAGYVLGKNRSRITAGNPEISLLYIVAKIRAYKQLMKIVQAFNLASLDDKEVEQVLYVLLPILQATSSSDAHKALQELVSGPKFRTAYAFTALQIELEHRPREFNGLIQKYASMILSVCREVERRGNESEKLQLKDSLEELSSQITSGAYARRTREVFKTYNTKPGCLRALVERIASG